jgi:hypothetical protein
MTSLPRDQLPFGAQIDPDASLEEIVQAHLDDASPGAIQWEELEEVPFPDPDQLPAESSVIPVWTVAIGGGGTRAHADGYRTADPAPKVNRS